MPSVPSYTKCQHLGCKEKRSRFNSFCLAHGGRDTLPVSKKRAEQNALYNTGYWRSIRAVQLSKHPLCASCLTVGRVTPANHVDHVFPWTQINEEAFYRNIFQSLCHSCHGEKTYWEQQGVIKLYGVRDLTLKDYETLCRG